MHKIDLIFSTLLYSLVAIVSQILRHVLGHKDAEWKCITVGTGFLNESLVLYGWSSAIFTSENHDLREVCSKYIWSDVSI